MTGAPKTDRKIHPLHYLMHLIHFLVTMIVVLLIHAAYISWVATRPHDVFWTGTKTWGQFQHTNSVTNGQPLLSIEAGILDDGTMVYRVTKP